MRVPLIHVHTPPVQLELKHVTCGFNYSGNYAFTEPLGTETNTRKEEEWTV